MVLELALEQGGAIVVVADDGDKGPGLGPEHPFQDVALCSIPGEVRCHIHDNSALVHNRNDKDI
jgi:hypothetical protein